MDQKAFWRERANMTLLTYGPVILSIYTEEGVQNFL
jgi:hypothetical protein